MDTAAKAIDQVKSYYDENAREEWDRLEHHPFEFLFTTYMMDRYIRPGDRILDIGGGPGRYSLHYARKGCAVTLVDLSEGNIAFARQKAAETGLTIDAHVQNCLALEELKLETFDHVFLMGPLYHLQEEADRITAVKNALKRLKPGGILYVSFILEFAGVLYDLKNAGLIVQDAANPATAILFDGIETGTDYRGPAFTSSYFYHQNNILPFMEHFLLEKLHLFGQEGILSPKEQDILRRDQAEIQQWVALGKRFLEVPELLSFSEHAMYIGRKIG